MDMSTPRLPEGVRVSEIDADPLSFFSASGIEVDKFRVWHRPVVHWPGKFRMAVHHFR